MRRRIRLLFTSILLMLSTCTSAFAIGLPAAGESLAGTIVILHTNDSHGRIPKDENNGQAGFTSVSAVKKAYEAAGATVLLLDAGDTLHGLPIATVNKGADVVTVMNGIGYDAMTPGNHDFNYGTARLTELSKEMNFPLLSANVITEETGEATYQGTVVIEKNGLRFGILGLTTPETVYKTNPNNVKGVKFGNPITYAATAVEQLQAQKVDYVIALAHIGVDAASEFTSDKIAAAVPGIDIIIDGHSHTEMVNGVPTNPDVKLVEHGSTLIASTGEYINNIGVVTIKPDQSKSSELIAYRADFISDTTIDAVVAGILTKQDEVLSQVVGTTSVRLEGDREYARKSETNLGNLVADSIRMGTGADLAFTNGGGLRASIVAGNITKKDLVTVFPFGNYIVTKKVTGAAVLEAMEHGVKSYPELAGGFPQVSGITFQIDLLKPVGSRVTDVKIGGTPLRLEAMYTIATNDFIAAGGDDYTMLNSFPIENEYGALEEVLTEYIEANPDKVYQVEGRITVVDGAQVPSVSGSEFYVVKAGDSLWKIAAVHTGSGNNWNAIYEMNRDILSNPDFIQIGQTLKIPA